jgi:hypothetical protein
MEVDMMLFRRCRWPNNGECRRTDDGGRWTGTGAGKGWEALVKTQNRDRGKEEEENGGEEGRGKEAGEGRGRGEDGGQGEGDVGRYGGGCQEDGGVGVCFGDTGAFSIDACGKPIPVLQCVAG